MFRISATISSGSGSERAGKRPSDVASSTHFRILWKVLERSGVFCKGHLEDVADLRGDLFGVREREVGEAALGSGVIKLLSNLLHQIVHHLLG